LIVTFYSYKGGVGRSMALANVADLLSRSGLRVLIVDFDLEAPGLEHFFPIDHDQVQAHKGLLDLLLTFKHSMSTASSGDEERNAFRQLDDFLTTVYPARDGGGIDLLPAGRRLSDEQIGRYGEELRRFDWLDFYFSWSGELFFEWLRQTFLDRYDAILVDSRTGVTEMGGICAYQLADIIVALCAPNLQNLEGTQAMVRHFLSEQVRGVRNGRPVEILIVPARVDQEDTNLQRTFEQRFEERFSSYLPAALAGHDLRLWDMQIPYEPRYAFDEQVVTDPSRAKERRGLAASYAKLLQAIALLAPEQSALAALRPIPIKDGEQRPRVPVETRYDPTRRFAGADVYVSFGRGSENHARQIQQSLLREGLTVEMSPEPRGQEASYTRAASDLVQAARVGLVLVGQENDWSKWRQREIDQLLTPGGQRSVYTVLLPGASRNQIPPPLSNSPMVDISSGSADLNSLLAAIRVSNVQPEAVPSTSSIVQRNPYPGMAPFRELDHDVYFGRESEVDDMLDRLRVHGACSVVGPASIGKTSAVFAGLVPMLRRGRLPSSERWPVVSMRPGERALSALVEALMKLNPAVTLAAEDVDAAAEDLDALVASLLHNFRHVVLVIDQFEELFTRTRESEQAQFISYLNELCSRARGLVMPLAIIRSDFLDELAEAADVAQLLAAASPVLIGPLSDDKLREAIESPARRFGVTLEPGLADRLLADVANEPGALTLLQFILHELWLNQKDGYLTHAAYEQAGGAVHGLANGADAALGALSADGREIARRVWLRLVEYEKNGVRPREPVEIGELISGLEGRGAGPDQVRAVVERFIDQRLLATNETPGQPLKVAMTSEALIDAWPTLQRWIADSRGALRARSRLDQAVREWVALGRDDAALLPRERVEQLLSAMGDTPLSTLEREYASATRRYSRAGRGSAVSDQAAPAKRAGPIARAVSGSGAGWRVFVSHTSELRNFPKPRSYVAEVERAISAAGHVIVDMRDFPAVDQPAAQVCVERVQDCDVYVGVLGTRYGSPVRDMPEVSYTELEFNTATEAGLDRLIFVLDTDSGDIGIPASQLIDREFGDRQDAFRDRVKDGGLTVQPFGNAAKLGQLVERSLRVLADTRRRMTGGLQREQVPAEPQLVRASKFVNPPPAVAPTWFQNREVETGLLAGHVMDPGIRLITVVGRGGVGKTALVCRLLKMFEANLVPDTAGRMSPITVGGIVYLSRSGAHRVEYPTLVPDLARLLPEDVGRRLLRLYQEQAPTEVMAAVLEAFPPGDPVVVLLDNLESVMDAATETLTEPALQEALTVLLTAPAHGVTVIATSRVTPTGLLGVEPGAQRQLPLDKGLAPADADTVLRELDEDGTLGLRDAPDELLRDLCAHTRGFPRALEAVKAILDGDRTLTPRDLLDRTGDLPEDRVVEVLVGEAYQLLDPPARQVMQALAVFPSPVSAVGVDFLLRPFDPTTNAAPIMARLVRRQLVRFHDGHYRLDAVDRDYALEQIPPGAPGDPTTVFSLAGLQALAADYYTQIRTPRESWRSLDDIQPQLAEFELRCAAGDYDTAATVLADIDFEHMQRWGHYRTLVDLHYRIYGRITDPALNAAHLGSLGNCYFSLGDYRKAVDLHTQALDIDRDIGNRYGEAVDLTNLGVCHASLGDYRQAVDLHTQALAISRDIGDRRGEANELGNLGLCHASLGDYRQAVDLHTQALDIDREIGNRYGEAVDLTNLGVCHASLGDYRQAVDLHTQALAISRDIGDRQGEATALGNLGRARLASGDPRQAVTLLEQATSVAGSTGVVEPMAKALSGMAQAHLELSDPAAALAATATTRETPPYPTAEPTMRLLEGLALLELHRANEAVLAFRNALAAADALLMLSDSNVAASQARVLALSGLAIGTADPAMAADAVQAFVQASDVISAAGVAADTRRLLNAIASQDQSHLLAGVHAKMEP
jgi:tetratricopeptide (TPR) repeat protein/cellulose biosynthesis protein BcsQ